MQVDDSGARQTFDKLHRAGLPAMEDLDMEGPRITYSTDRREASISLADVRTTSKDGHLRGSVSMLKREEGVGWLVVSEDWNAVVRFLRNNNLLPDM